MNRHSPEIVIIDDVISAAKDYADLLESKLHLDVKYFDNPDLFIEYIKSNSVKVAILDQVMPIKSGTDLFNEMHKIDPLVRAIMLSGEASAQDISNALNLGFSKHINKANIADLAKIVVDQIAKYERDLASKAKSAKEIPLLKFNLIQPAKLYLVSLTPYERPFTTDQGEEIIDLTAGTSIASSFSRNIETTIKEEKKIINQLSAELNIDDKSTLPILSKINNHLSTEYSDVLTQIIEEKESTKQEFSLPAAPPDPTEIYIARRVIIQYPQYQRYQVVLKSKCWICKQERYLTFIMTRQTKKSKRVQIDYYSDGTQKEIDLRIHVSPPLPSSRR